MFKPFLIVPVLFLLTTGFLQQNPPASTPGQTEPSTSPDYAAYANKMNPVAPTPASQARAKQIYGWDCAPCHGDNGDGKGSVAAEQKLTIADFRDPNSLKQLKDGEIFYIIRYGKGQMPAEDGRAKTDEAWNLVIYLREMEQSPAPASAQPPA